MLSEAGHSNRTVQLTGLFILARYEAKLALFYTLTNEEVFF